MLKLNNNFVKWFTLQTACCVLFIISTFGLIWFYLTPSADIDIINNEQFLFDFSAHWSQGNMVALIRHTERCDRSDNPCLLSEEKKGITIKGKETTLIMAQDIKFLLQQHKTDIFNSPLIRTKQTADFLFQGQSIKQDWLREGCKTDFLDKIIKNKQTGKNMILVTHSTCMQSLKDRNGKKLIHNQVGNKHNYGITYFLIVNKNASESYLLGYLKPQDWGSFKLKEKEYMQSK